MYQTQAAAQIQRSLHVSDGSPVSDKKGTEVVARQQRPVQKRYCE